MYIIIGAGPAGLYLALKLKKAGLHDIVVYDPRLNQYVRPGHLNSSVFNLIAQELNIKIDIKMIDIDTAHIKDLERILYQEALNQNIKMEKKEFLSLQKDPQTPGVIVVNESGVREFIAASYVFDCSGTSRIVVNAVNQELPNSPLKLEQFTSAPISTHFLANIFIEQKFVTSINNASPLERDRFPTTENALVYAQQLIKLRSFGWKEVVFPICHAKLTGSKKACLYLEFLDHIKEEQYDEWIQSVIECYLPNVSYSHLPASRKYQKKPRFTPFRLGTSQLSQVSFKGDNLPTVIALGDAQIDPLYESAHGIENGILRINALFKDMIIDNNQITYFEPEKYQQQIEHFLKIHKQNIIDWSNRIRTFFSSSLEPAHLKVREAVLISKDPAEKDAINALLKEVEARLHFEKARQLFKKTHDGEGMLLTQLSSAIAASTHRQLLNSSWRHNLVILLPLEPIHNHLLKAFEDLPPNFAQERYKTLKMLVGLANSWKEYGNYLHGKKRVEAAIDAYQKALEIYNLPLIQMNYHDKQLIIYSNLALVYFNGQQYAEAIAAGQTGLAIYNVCPKTDASFSIYNKLVFNLLRSFCAEAKRLLSDQSKDAEQYQQNAMNMFMLHKDKVNELTMSRLKESINSLNIDFADQLIQYTGLSDSERIAALNRFGTFSACSSQDNVSGTIAIQPEL